MEVKNLKFLSNGWRGGGASHITLPKAHISIPVATIIGICILVPILYVIIRVMIELKRDKKIEAERKRKIIEHFLPKKRDRN